MCFVKEAVCNSLVWLYNISFSVYFQILDCAMSAVELTDPQNTALGVAAAFIEGVILQPTLYWKNARAMKLPFTLDPRVIYRGTGASIFNEMQMMGLQFGITGFFNKIFANDSGSMSVSNTFISAILGGVITATFSCPVELVMIQQQKHSGSLIGTPIRIAKQFGVGSGGLFRGLTLTMTRDGIYVAGMLGMTPLMQQYLMDKQNMSINRASFVASVVGG